MLAAVGLLHLLVAAGAGRLSEWGDLALFRLWAEQAATGGIVDAYTSPEFGYDWGPLYLYVSRAVGLAYYDTGLAAGLGPHSLVLDLLLKTPMVLLNLAVAAMLFHLALGLYGRRGAAFGVAVAWALNPAIAAATDLFGYQDALHTGVLVAAAACLMTRRPAGAGALMGLALLTKPQAWVFLLPFAFYLGRTGGKPGLARGAAGAAVAVAVVLAPFAAAGRLGDVAGFYGRVPGYHPFLSATAHNVWWALAPAADETELPSDRAPLVLGLDGRSIGLLLLAGAAALAVRGLLRRPEPLALASLSAFLAFAFFMLATQIHENHLYAMFPFLTLAAPASPLYRRLLIVLTLTFGANLFLALLWLHGHRLATLGPVMPSVLNAVVNLVMLAVWTWHVLRRSG